MTTRRFTQLYKCLCVGMLSLSLFISCSDKQSIDPVPEQEQVSVTLSPGVRAGYSTGTLKYGAYIFSSPKDQGNYKFFSMLSPFVSGSKLKIGLSDLVNSDFRFLFIALPESVSEQTVVLEYSEGGNTVPVTGSSSGFTWERLRVNRPGVDLTADYYYGVTDISGTDIIHTERVEGTLNRMVGQMTFDFFKTNGTADDPVGIDTGYTSVLDRVYQIDVNYTGLTSRLMFDGNKTLIPDLAAAPYTLTETVTITYDPATGTVTPADKSSGPAVEKYLPEGATEALYTGAARVRGAYLFPADNGVKATLTVRYFDTVPTCGNAHAGDHDLQSCYDKTGTLTLNLPKTGTLSVYSNMFTANKAGIPCNRVIDVPVNSSVGISTGWDASQSVAPVE